MRPRRLATSRLVVALRRAALRLAALTALPLLAAGCDHDAFEYARIDQQRGDPGATFTPMQIVVPVGEAISARVQLFDDDDDRMGEQLISDDPSVLAIRPTTDASTYILLGVKEGKTTVHLLANGDDVKQIPAAVTPQTQ